MFKLTYNLTFFAGDEPLSANKCENFASIEDAQERADELAIKYHEHYDYSVRDFAIDDVPFLTIFERIEKEREEEYWDEYWKESEADRAICLAKDENSNDADYLPF